MDAAWALYEAWVAIQTGEVDSALIYGFGKSSPGDLHEIMALQTDPYYVLPLWPSMVDMAALQASAYLEASGKTEKDLAEVAARSQRNAQGNPTAVREGNVTAADMSRAAGHAPPLRDADIPPITDGAARDRDRGRRRGAQRRSEGRRGSAASSIASRRTVSVCATSRRRSRREQLRQLVPSTGVPTAESKSPSCTRSSATRS